ncbi:P-loop containing nucleoside triphosphate hydrolase protein [Talaromyces proteolyticus]|uniref:P-loop containing nucleoside triphosphate hydrolase protein n=1 Tax=Talaromyces proteolyticus TaxID=1131652 RepID=A0AAD4L2W8_9EURO|nr:P-loop containing nucleoside triphosphate hydrolase protein [Talaromyces proteolyticus]KAH8705621.1 P-loop containing nucleoside triphosphate hydrolase protein [Talaromyces proteolyticus]
MDSPVQPNDRPQEGHQYSSIQIYGENRVHLGDNNVHHHHYYSRDVIEDAQISLPDKRKPKRAWMVPFLRNHKFVGRDEEITTLKEFILKDHGQKKIAISGLGGVGKTQIALEVAYYVRDHDSDRSVFWIPCISLESLEQAYMSIAQYLALLNVSPADVKTRVKSHLSQEDAGKWLLIYDNADDLDLWIHGNGTVPALKDMLPQSDYGRIIFTTRTQKLANRLAPSNFISVPEMNKAMAKELLQNLIQKEIDDNDTITTLLEELTFLPLAIAQAAAYINENQIGVSDYLALLQEQEQDIIEILSEHFADDGRYSDTQNAVATTWLVSFRQIQKLNSFAVDYLSFMACLNPRDIPLSLLPPAASQKEKIDTLGLLNSYSFTTKQENESLTLHRLVHLATRNWMRQDGRLQLWTYKTADRLNELFLHNAHAYQKVRQDYLPHAIFLIFGAEFQMKRAEYFGLIHRVGSCLLSGGRYKEAEVLYNDVKNICKLRFTAEHPDTLGSIRNLAVVYSKQGRWKEAEELELQVMETRKQVLGAEHPDTLISMDHLAQYISHQGRWKDAEELELQVVQTRKKVLGAEHPHTLTSMGNLALMCQYQGHLEKAEKLQVEIFQISKKIFGEENPHTLTSMGNLASTYCRQQRWKEAQDLLAEESKLLLQLLGAEHPDTLISMNNLALTYFDQGRLREAEELEIQIMETRKRILGADHPHTLTSMENLAVTWKALGKDEDAISLLANCTQLRIQKLGPEHPDTVSARVHLAKWQEINSRPRRIDGLFKIFRRH